MSKVRKLTPAILKRIIKEEKTKLANERKINKIKNSKKHLRSKDELSDIISETVNEAKLLLKLKRLQDKTKKLKRSLKTKSK